MNCISYVGLLLYRKTTDDLSLAIFIGTLVGAFLQVPLALERCSSADGGNPEADLAHHIAPQTESGRTAGAEVGG